MPVALIFVCILAYGLLVPWLGFYLDDWYIVLYQKYFGPHDFSLFFRGDRPLFAYIYQIFVPIFRDSKLGWQIFAVAAHALASITFWWFLLKLMPQRRKLAAVAALLFAIYPGFQFHWFSVMYSQAYMIQVLYFLSYILMIDAIQKKKTKIMFTLAAVVCLIIGIVPAEDFFGLEVVRPFVIFVVCHDLYANNRQRIKHTMLNWLPYLVAVIGFLVYRLGFSQEFSYQVNILTQLRTAPIQTIIKLVGEVFWSTVDSTITTWVNLTQLLQRDLLTAVSIVMLLLILVGFLVTYLVLRNKKDEDTTNRWVILVGLLATVSSMAPYIAGSFNITLDYPNNRYLIAMAPGAALFLTGLIEALFKTEKQKLVTISILVGFAIGSQFLVARSFMLNWKAQQDFIWQLSWRAPEIKPNTVLVTEDLPFSKYFSGTSLTAPLNLIYAPDSNDHKIPYFMVLTAQQEEAIKSYDPDQPVKISFRSFEFLGNTSSMLVFKKPADGCLRVLSAEDSPAEFMKNQDDYFWQQAIPLSNPEQIITDSEDPAIPQKAYFGIEDRNQWCYYFEKADLARQQQQWQQVINLYQQAQTLGFRPLQDAEWLPLLEAFLNTDQANKALEITRTVENLEQANTAGFCSLWTRADSLAVDSSIIEEALVILKCQR